MKPLKDRILQKAREKYQIYEDGQNPQEFGFYRKGGYKSALSDLKQILDEVMAEPITITLSEKDAEQFADALSKPGNLEVINPQPTRGEQAKELGGRVGECFTDYNYNPHIAEAIAKNIEHSFTIINKDELVRAKQDSGSEKPDGYVAWRPARAFDEKYDIIRGECDYGGHKNYSISGRRYEYIEVYQTPKMVERHSDPFRLEKQNEGWQIRPVKLLFLDTPQGGKDE